MHESQKSQHWGTQIDAKMYMCLVAQSCPTLRDPMDCSSPGSSVHRDSLDKNTRAWVACSPPGDLPNPGSKPRSPALQADSLLSEPPGKSMNTGVGSLSLLQGNFLTQELNQGFLHCRRMLYQLSLPYFLLCIPTFSLLNSYFVVIFLIN